MAAPDEPRFRKGSRRCWCGSRLKRGQAASDELRDEMRASMATGLRWTEEQLQAARQRRPVPVRTRRAPKYGNTKTERDGIRYDSAKSRVLADLETLERLDIIRDLRRQVPFAIVIDGIHVCDHVADAVYMEGARRVVSRCQKRGNPETARVSAQAQAHGCGAWDRGGGAMTWTPELSRNCASGSSSNTAMASVVAIKKRSARASTDSRRRRWRMRRSGTTTCRCFVVDSAVRGMSRTSAPKSCLNCRAALEIGTMPFNIRPNQGQSDGRAPAWDRQQGYARVRDGNAILKATLTTYRLADADVARRMARNGRGTTKPDPGKAVGLFDEAASVATMPLGIHPFGNRTHRQGRRRVYR